MEGLGALAILLSNRFSTFFERRIQMDSFVMTFLVVDVVTVLVLLGMVATATSSVEGGAGR
jgi:hypothetical protein